MGCALTLGFGPSALAALVSIAAQLPPPKRAPLDGSDGDRLTVGSVVPERRP